MQYKYTYHSRIFARFEFLDRIMYPVAIRGIPIAGLVGVLYVFSLLIAFPIASIAFGSWAIKVFKKEKNYKVDYKTAVIGVVALKIVKIIEYSFFLFSHYTHLSSFDYQTCV